MQIYAPDNNQGRAALCFSGQFRSFNATVDNIKEHLISAFAKPDVFLFLNLQDSGRGGMLNHAGKDVNDILSTLKPKGVQYYSESELALEKGLEAELGLEAGSTCYQAKGTPGCCHWSWHVPQFWTIQKCFEMAKEYEATGQFRYEWFVRARPDTRYHPKIKVAIQHLMGFQPDGGTKHAYLKKGPMSDTFALLSRDAADVYGDMPKKFIGDSCTHLPGADQCEPVEVPGNSTECFVYRNLLSGRVNVHFDGVFSSKIVRPYPPKPRKR